MREKNAKKLTDYRGRTLTRYYVDLYDDNENYRDVKEVLDRVEGKGALIKDAIIAYVKSDSFRIGRYEGNASRRSDK